MVLILHITKRNQWKQAELVGVHRGDTLDIEDFMHGSSPRQVVNVANTVFKTQRKSVLLCIESDKGYDKKRDTEKKLGPHIYDPLNIDAARVLDFEPNQVGTFQLPKETNDAIQHTTRQ